MTDTIPNERELKLTAALYASRSFVMDRVRKTGRLPNKISMPGADIGMRVLIERRGTDITLTEDEQLMFDAILRDRRLPGGSVILLDGKNDTNGK